MKRLPLANVKQKPDGSREALAALAWSEEPVPLRAAKPRFIGRSHASFFMHRKVREHWKRWRHFSPFEWLKPLQKSPLFILMKRLPTANVKQKPDGFREALAALAWSEAPVPLRAAKPRFIGQSPASFFMHRKVRFIEKSTSEEVLFSGVPGGIRTHGLSLRRY